MKFAKINHLQLTPYSPIFEATTSLRHERQDYALYLQFKQSYNCKNHLGRSLPEALSLDLGGSWMPLPHLKLKAELINLLDTRNCRNLNPTQGIVFKS